MPILISSANKKYGKAVLSYVKKKNTATNPNSTGKK